jgi:hypothetical protein
MGVNSSKQSLLLVAPVLLTCCGPQGKQGESEPPGEYHPKLQMAHWLRLASKPQPGAHTLHWSSEYEDVYWVLLPRGHLWHMLTLPGL